MTIRTKTDEEVEILKVGGAKLARILVELTDMIEPGVTTAELNNLASKRAHEDGDRPAFLNYQPSGVDRPFPGSVCISTNDEIVHGIPNEEPYTFRDGDLVKLDLGIIHRGLVTDSAITVGVGSVSPQADELMRATKKALECGIEATQPGGRVGDVGAAIQAYVESTPFNLVKGLSGHGVGYEVHEEPFVPNENTAGVGDELVPGTVIAIEPMCTTGSRDIMVDQDGFTIRTADGSRAAHFEHTVAVREDRVEIITQDFVE